MSSKPFVLPELYFNPEFTWGPPAEEMLIDGEPFQLYRKPDRSDRNDRPPLPPVDFSDHFRSMDFEAKKRGNFKKVDDEQRINALSSAKSKHTNNRYNNRNNQNNRFVRRRNDARMQKRAISILPNTISIPSGANVLGDFTAVQLSKEVQEVDPSVVDLGLFSLPPIYNYQLEKDCSVSPVPLTGVDFRDKYIVRPDALQDSSIKEFVKQEDPTIPVIAITDEVLSLLLTANRATHPWHVKVLRHSNRYIICRPEKEDHVNKQWVGETAPNEFAPTEDCAIQSERISTLGEESTRVHEGFIRAACMKSKAKISTMPNPFPKTQPRMYRYRRFILNKGTPNQYHVLVRCEVDAVDSKKNEYIRMFGLLEQTNTTKERWCQRIERKNSAAILPDEFHSNVCKISRWIALSLLSDVALMKIGFLSRAMVAASPFGGPARYRTDEHCIQMVESIPPSNLARQLNINYKSMWSTANVIFSTLLEKMESNEGVIMKNSNHTVCVVEGMAGDSDSDSEYEEGDEEDSDDDEESDEEESDDE